MQVFITGSPIETAQALDARRFNKQLVECKQILDAIDGAKAWRNHPCVLQYKEHREWLVHYMYCLMCYQRGWLIDAGHHSKLADSMRPSFHTDAYFDQMKRRLYTKMPEHYNQWELLGESDVNWYFVDGEWRYYRDGKRIEL